MPAWKARLDLSWPHAKISLAPKRPVAIPVVTREVEVSVDGNLDGDAIRTRLAKAALAFPVPAGAVKVGVWRNRDRHASLIGLAEAALALPAVVE